MEYNDFQISSEETFKIMNDQFNHLSNFDRRNSINQINILIQDCKTIIMNISPNINNKLRKQIQNLFQTLKKMEDNFKSLFTLSNTQQHTIKQFNIFAFLKRIIKLISLFQEWAKHEKKEYYLIFIFNSTQEIIANIENIFQQLENLNIFMFKYM